MATYTIDKIEFGSNVYNIEDANALPKSGGTVTGPVVFSDSVSMTELTTGNVVVTGNASVTNNIQANTINGVTVGSSPKFTDTTYSSLAAASGGTAVSLVTTGEKYTWNNKASTDTKNTAGSTDTSSKIFLIGATSQAANPQTYSHDTAYVGTDGKLYSGSKVVLTGGSNASSTVSITPSTTNVYSMTSAGSVTAGTANVPTVIDTSKFSGGSFTRGSFSGGSFTQGTDSFTANTPTAINTSKFSGGSFTRGTFSGGSFTRGTFSQGTLPTLTFAMDTTDTAQLNITFGQGTLPTHAADSFTPASHAADSFTPASLQSGFYTAGTAASFTQGTDSFTAATHANDSFTAAKLNSGFYTAGTANTPTAVTLPGRSSAIAAWTGYTAATAAAQTFTGTS